jgi:hypothetical protein
MDYISGLEKIKNLGADIKINENGTMEIAINMSLLSPEEKALALKMKENVSCIKCGKSIPFILAMFNKKSNKPYCPDCSGYCIDVIGNINSTNKNSDIKTTGKVIEGERWIKEKYDYFGLPLMVRENTVLAVGSDKEKTDYDYTDSVTFHIFQLNKEAKIQSTVNNINGETALTINLERNNDKIVINANGVKNKWNVLLRNIFEVKEVLGGKAETSELGTLIVANTLAEEIHIILQ